MSDILTYRLKVKNKTLLYHSFEGARVYSKRCWLKPGKKRWYVEISLFTFFSFDEGHEKIICDGMFLGGVEVTGKIIYNRA